MHLLKQKLLLAVCQPHYLQLFSVMFFVISILDHYSIVVFSTIFKYFVHRHQNKQSGARRPRL